MTPTRLTASSQSASQCQASVWPVMSVRAGIGAASPDEMIAAAEEAAVWLILF